MALGGRVVLLKRLGVGLVALALSACGLLPQLPLPGPTPSGFATPTPGQQFDLATFEQAVADLRAEVGDEGFWVLELKAPDSDYHSHRVEVLATDLNRYEWRDGEITNEGTDRAEGVVPLGWDEVDLPAIMEYAQPSYAKFYECRTIIESVGFQGMVTIDCDSKTEAQLSLDLRPMRADFSSAQAMAETLELLAVGTSHEFSVIEMAGPIAPFVSVDFTHDSELYGVELRRSGGMETTDFGWGTPGPYDLLDAELLYACAQQMQAASGEPGWWLSGSVEDDGSLRLYWDLHGMWDPEQSHSITNERCEVLAP